MAKKPLKKNPGRKAAKLKTARKTAKAKPVRRKKAGPRAAAALNDGQPVYMLVAVADYDQGFEVQRGRQNTPDFDCMSSPISLPWTNGTIVHEGVYIDCQYPQDQATCYVIQVN